MKSLAVSVLSEFNLKVLAHAANSSNRTFPGTTETLEKYSSSVQPPINVLFNQLSFKRLKGTFNFVTRIDCITQAGAVGRIDILNTNVTDPAGL